MTRSTRTEPARPDLTRQGSTRPQRPERPLFDEALARHGRGDLDGAEQLYHRHLAQEKSDPDALTNLSALKFVRGEMAAAEQFARQALAALSEESPAAANAWNCLAIALKRQGRRGEAIDALKHCVALDPSHAEAWSNLADAERRAGRPEAAAAAVDRCLALKPDYAPAVEIGLYTKLELCAWNDLDALLTTASRLIDRGVPFNPYSLIFVCLDPRELLACAQNQARRAAVETRRVAQFEPKPRRRSSRLRIGYFSSQFRAHATAYLLEEVLEAHDRERFEIFGYDYSRAPEDDLIARKMRATFDCHRDLADASAEETIATMRADDLDILVDINGHADGGRLGVLAPRVAPAQVSWLGFVGTTGAKFMDYILLDDVMAPEGEETHCSERVIRLPGTFFPSGSRVVDPAPRDRTDFGLPAAGRILCAFNQSRKINPLVLELWSAILKAEPDTLLWLWCQNESSIRNLRSAFADRGVRPDRVLATPSMVSPVHLTRYRYATLYLDAFPCNGHTMMTDALYMGVPAVTWAGPTLASRVGASLLTALGLPDLVASNGKGYVALALRLLRDDAFRLDACARLSDPSRRARVFDAKAYARKLEGAFLNIAEASAQE